jgi:FkbM family methyltransferase
MIRNGGLGATIRPYARRTLRRLGLTDVARRAFMRLADERRTVSVDGARPRFLREEFGDHVELNQIAAEAGTIGRLRDEIRPDDVFLDVGSNLGAYAVFVGETLETGHVIAVEAVPSTADKLRRNLALNDVDATVATVAFGADPGTVSMTVPDAHGSSAVTTDGGDVDVRRVRGDDYLDRSDLPSPTVVKVDVEGYELSVVEGLRESLRDPACRLVYCEVHPARLRAFGGSAPILASTLSDLGFETSRIADLPGERYVLRAAKP